MQKIQLLAVTFLFTALAGCSNMGTGQTFGTVGGGVAGGLLGSTIGQGTGNTAAIIGGTVAGAMLGGAAGKDYDQSQ